MYVLILYLIQQTYTKQKLNALHRMMYMINRGKFSEEIESHLVPKLGGPLYKSISW